jgi:hypothetical protein
VRELNKALLVVALLGLAFFGFSGFMLLAMGKYAISLISFLTALVFLNLYKLIMR